MEDSGGEIACSNCETPVSIYVHKYDEGLSGYKCGSCKWTDWVSDAPAESNPRKCPECGDYVTDEDVEGGLSVRCNARDDWDERCCDQLAHIKCVESCDECGWLCPDEEGNYIRCDDCGLLHNPSDFPSLGGDFVDSFGHICWNCFNGKGEEEPGPEAPKPEEPVETEEPVEPYATARPRSDCSIYLSHFFGRTEKNEEKCLKLLIEVIKKQKLEARPTGYFTTYDKIPAKTAISKAVCLTEGRLDALVEHAEKFSGFGLAFLKFYLHKNFAAAPAIYIHGSLMAKVRAGIPDELVPFVNMIDSGKYDFSHEREWRSAADITFKPSDLKIVYAPLKFHDVIRAETGFKGQIICLDRVKSV